MQHGPAASSGSNPKAPGSAGGYLLRFRHVISGSQRSPLSTLPVGIFSDFSTTSPPLLLTTAACGGLRSTPDCRPRRTFLHLSYSCATPFGPAILVTQDPTRTSRHRSRLDVTRSTRRRAGSVRLVFQARSPFLATRLLLGHRLTRRAGSTACRRSEICQINDASSVRACVQIDPSRLPDDMHGPHNSQPNTKTCRDWPGIEIGDQIGHPRNLLPPLYDVLAEKEDQRTTFGNGTAFSAVAPSLRPAVIVRRSIFGNAPRTSGINRSRGDAQIGGYPPLPLKKNWMPKRGACPVVGALLVCKTAVHCESPPRLTRKTERTAHARRPSVWRTTSRAES